MKKREQEGGGGVWFGFFDYFWAANPDIMRRLAFSSKVLIMRSLFSGIQTSLHDWRRKGLQWNPTNGR